MWQRMLIMLVSVAVVLGGVFGFIAFKDIKMREYFASQGDPVQTVATVQAGYQDWLPTLKAIGTLRAVQGTGLSLELPGLVKTIRFKQGDRVRTGDALLELDASADEAKLAALQASAELAQLTYRRDQAQLSAKAISQQVLDASRANFAIAQAQVAEQRALLQKKTLHAPFAGTLGLRRVDVGQYLQAGEQVSSLQDLTSLYVDFWVPQRDLAQLKTGQKVRLRTDAYPGQEFSAQVAVIEPQADANSRNVMVRAAMENPGQRLLPGMFVTLDLLVSENVRWLTLPRTAITFNPYGATVFKVVQDGVDEKGQGRLSVRQHFVKTGLARGDQVAVLDGITEGDTVVVAGQIKLRNGTPVVINNAVLPSNQADPQPQDQ